MKFLRVLVFLLLLLLGYLGLSNGVSDSREAETTGQLIVSIAVTIYGITSLTAVYGLWRKKPWTRAVIILWAISVQVAGSLAAWAYGGNDVGAFAIVTSGLATAIIVGAVLLFVFRDLRRGPPTPTPSSEHQ